MDISSVYTHTVDVKRETHTVNDSGDTTNTWSDQISSYDCRIYRPTGESEVEDLGHFEGTDFKVVGNTADIEIGDKLIDGSDEYLVKRSVKKYDDSSAQFLELLVDKVT